MTSAFRALLAVCSLPACLLAQPAGPPYSIIDAAGAPFVLGDNGPATSAVLKSPQFIAVDGSGNLYIGENLGYRFRKVSPSGVITTIAGTGVSQGPDVGKRAATSDIDGAFGIALDKNGNIYFSVGDVWNISASGLLGIVVSNANGYGGDGGPASAAGVGTVAGMKFDQAGNLYLADMTDHRIRKIDTNGIITTVAGNGSAGFSGDGGAATAAQLYIPNDIAVDASGNLYIADQGNNRVRMVTPGGTISTYAGTGTAGSSGDGGSATKAQLNNPVALVLDSTGRLYVSESGGARVRRITPTATGTLIETVAGTGTAGFQGDGGPAASAEIDTPWGLAMDSAGNLYIAEEGTGQRVRRVTPGGIISTVAGATHFAGDGGPASLAQLGFPQSLTTDGSGSLYVADTQNHRIRQVTPDGNISTIAGNGTSEAGGDGGQAANATVTDPTGVTLDSAGNLYFSDSKANRVRMITPGGIIGTIAGNGSANFGGDGGPATAATLNSPQGLAVDSNSNLYIADQGNNRIRMVNSKGIISTVAGTTLGFGGDGGLAMSAKLAAPVDVAVDSAGNLYIADLENYRVRKVDSNHIISTVAGSGQDAFAGDGGPATAAGMRHVTSVKVDNANRIFIGDPWDGRIRMVDSNGVISTVAGTGTRESNGDGGLATGATIGGPVNQGYGLAFGPGGVVYFADYLGEEIRRLTPHVPQLTILSGNNQSGTPDTALASPLIVSVADPAGVPFVGVTVTFAVTSGSANLGLSSTLTNASGQAGVSVMLGAAVGQVTVTASVPGLPSVTFNLTSGTSIVATGPLISAGGVVGGGLSVPAVTQISTGAIVSIFGQNFAPAGSALRMVGGADLVNGQLPTQLGGVCVTMNGQAAAMLLVSPLQLNVQVPSIPASGNVAVQVIANCGQTDAATSAAVMVAAQPATPEFFFFAHNANGQNPVAALNAVTGANIGTPNSIPGVTFVAAQSGDILSIFMTGLGATNPPNAPGVLPPAAAPVSAAVTVTLGALTLPAANVQYAGVAPGNAGLYQVNIQIPPGAPAGNLPLTVTVGGISTPVGGYLTIGQ